MAGSKGPIQTIDLRSAFVPTWARGNTRKKLAIIFSGRGLFKGLGILFLKVVARLKRPFGLADLVLNRFMIRDLAKELKSLDADLIIANDLTALPLAVASKGRSRILFDAHEYSPGQLPSTRQGRKRNAWARYLMRKYMPFCDRMTTVSDGIADEYEKSFSITRPDVIVNAAPFQDLVPVERKDGKILLVHHGISIPLRKIEETIKAMSFLDERFELHFYLVQSDLRYHAGLVSLSKGDRRIVFHDPVPMSEIPVTLNHYDIGIAMFQPITFNIKHVLPNKFFEFIQARIAVAIGPSPEMEAYVRRCELGLIAMDFTAEALAEKLATLSLLDIARYKMNAHRHALELSAGAVMKRFNGIVKELI
ncbi:MAG: glycosyltransferase [Rectinemataceae bacterium]